MTEDSNARTYCLTLDERRLLWSIWDTFLDHTGWGEDELDEATNLMYKLHKADAVMLLSGLPPEPALSLTTQLPYAQHVEI